MKSLSPSRALMFKKCPQQYKFRAIDKIPDEPGEAQVVGTVVHRVLEMLMVRSSAERTPKTAQDIWGGLVIQRGQEWSDLSAGGLEKSRKMVENYFELEDPRTVQPRRLEYRVDLDVGDLNLRGIIDRIDEDGTLVDYKTGRPPGPRYEQSSFFGLRFYASLCRHALGFVPSEVKLLYLSSKEQLTLKPDPDLLTGFERQILAISNAITRAQQRNDWRARPGPLCKWCNYVEICPAWEGVTPPWLSGEGT